MAPYRPNGQSRRSGARGYVDHDVFEGIPVRHWRRTTVQVGVPLKPETPSRLLQQELPLPKEANLLTPMSRALLQAARAGTINKTPPAEEEAVVKEGEDEEDDEERGFVASRWGVVPRHLEGPEPEYLAKKRKGLEPKAAMGGAGAGGGVVKKAKVRRTDTEGNAYVEEVVMADGQTVEGEVIAEVPMADAGVPGTVLEGMGAVNSGGPAVATETIQPTPPRRRPPPPRRKPRGPGRGRKKKVQFVPGAEGMDATGARGVAAAAANGSLVESGPPSGESTLSRVRLEGAFGNDDGDTEILDDSNLRDGDEEDDENDEGDEGDEGDDDDREEGELTPSPTPDDAISSIIVHPLATPQASTALSQSTVPNRLVHPLPRRPDVRVPAADPVQRSDSSSPDLPLAGGQKSDPPVNSDEGEALEFSPVNESVTALIDDRIPTPKQEGPAQDDLAQKYLVLEDPPQDNSPQQTPSQANLLREDLLQEGLLQEDLLQEDLLQEDLLQEDPLQEDPLQEDQPQEDPAPLPQIEEPNKVENEAMPPADIVRVPRDTATNTASENTEASEEVHFPDGDIDLFGSLEKHLAEHSSTLAAIDNPQMLETPDDNTGVNEGEAK